MLMKMIDVLAVMDSGIPLDGLNRYIAGKPELYEGEHQEVEATLKKVLGNDFDDFITYSRVNNVVYSL